MKIWAYSSGWYGEGGVEEEVRLLILREQRSQTGPSGHKHKQVEIWESNSGSVGIHEKEVVRHSICENNGGKLGPGGTREGLSLPTLYTPKGVFARQKM